MSTPPSEKPTILWVHPGGLLPVSGGGAARTWALIDFLRASGFRVELLTGDQGSANALIDARVDRLWIQDRRRGNGGKSKPSLRAGMLRLLASACRRFDPDLRTLYRINSWLGRRVAPVEPRLFDRNRRPKLEAFTGEVAYKTRPAAVIASYLWLAPALDHVPPGTLRIIDTIDIQHERQAAARAAGGHLPHVGCSREEEVRELNRADIVLAIQAAEAETLRTLCPEREVILAEHAHPVPAYLPSPADSREFLYVGNLYDPNVLGLKIILSELWPKIRSACPEATLTVCGRVASSVRRPPAGVALAGRVPDLAPYYARAAVVLNPVPYGTGLKIKTVEALCHGRCVVCSEAGAGGLDDPASLPLIVARPGGDMADRVLEVLKDPSLRHDYEQRAWHYARERYAPDAVYGPLLARLRKHLSPP
jgi:glycosyltransferase involved in cell wall biosynthesis